MSSEGRRSWPVMASLVRRDGKVMEIALERLMPEILIAVFRSISPLYQTPSEPIGYEKDRYVVGHQCRARTYYYRVREPERRGTP